MGKAGGSDPLGALLARRTWPSQTAAPRPWPCQHASAGTPPPRASFTLGPHPSPPPHTPRAAHTSRRPRLSAPPCIARRLPHCPFPRPSLPSAHLQPTHISPLTSPHTSPHLPTHILEPPVRQDAKPATARRLGSHVPCGPKSGVDPPRCFAGGALFRVGSHSLPVSATAHAAPPSLPSLPQQLLSQASPRPLPGISPASPRHLPSRLSRGAHLAAPAHPPT